MSDVYSVFFSWASSAITNSVYGNRRRVSGRSRKCKDADGDADDCWKVDVRHVPDEASLPAYIGWPDSLRTLIAMDWVVIMFAGVWFGTVGDLLDFQVVAVCEQQTEGGDAVYRWCCEASGCGSARIVSRRQNSTALNLIIIIIIIFVYL